MLLRVGARPDLDNLDAMRARDLVETAPTVTLDDSVADALQLMKGGAPGVVVVDAEGAAVTVLAATQVLGLALPGYLHGQPGLVRAWDEAHADRFAATTQTLTVGQALGERRPPMSVVNDDDTLIEVAFAMCEQHAPLLAVVKGGVVVGAIRLRVLLETLLPGDGQTA